LEAVLERRGTATSLKASLSKNGELAHNPVKTALPANIEDEDLDDSRPLQPQPSSKRTKMSYQLARLKFIEFTYRQIWQANNRALLPYSEV
jgi:hypothetical protein